MCALDGERPHAENRAPVRRHSGQGRVGESLPLLNAWSAALPRGRTREVGGAAEAAPSRMPGCGANLDCLSVGWADPSARSFVAIGGWHSMKETDVLLVGFGVLGDPAPARARPIRRQLHGRVGERRVGVGAARTLGRDRFRSRQLVSHELLHLRPGRGLRRGPLSTAREFYDMHLRYYRQYQDRIVVDRVTLIENTRTHSIATRPAASGTGRRTSSSRPRTDAGSSMHSPRSTAPSATRPWSSTPSATPPTS